MKTIDSPVKRWPGQVILHDPLTNPQMVALDSAFAGYVENCGKHMYVAADFAFLPGALLCVAEWHLKDFPEYPSFGNFPNRPHKDRHALIDWLAGELLALYKDAEEIPLASSPSPTPMQTAEETPPEN